MCKAEAKVQAATASAFDLRRSRPQTQNIRLLMSFCFTGLVNHLNANRMTNICGLTKVQFIALRSILTLYVRKMAKKSLAGLTYMDLMV